MKQTLSIALRTVLLLTVLPTVDAADEAEKWTAQKALEEIHALVHWKAGSPGLKQRTDAIKAWLQRVKESGIDLGEREYVVGVAQYYARDNEAANETLVRYLKEHGSFPSSDYDQLLGRVLLSATGSAVNANDFTTVELTLPVLLELSSNPKLVYHRIGGSLRRAKRPETHKLLNWMVRHVLDAPDLNDTEKQQILEGMYGSTKTTVTRTSRRPSPPSQALGPRPLRPFTATDLDGKKISLSDYEGKVVLVDFWATWCGPCLVEMPNVVRAYNNYHASGFEIIGISLDHAGAESRLRSTMKRFKMPWRQIYDGKGWSASIAVANGVRKIPTTYLLDRTGKVRYTSLRGRTLSEKVAELLKEEPPAE